DDRGRAVGRMIIDHEDAQIRAGLGAQAGKTARDVVRFIARGNDYGDTPRVRGTACGEQRSERTLLAPSSRNEPGDDDQPQDGKSELRVRAAANGPATETGLRDRTSEFQCRSAPKVPAGVPGEKRASCGSQASALRRAHCRKSRRPLC